MSGRVQSTQANDSFAAVILTLWYCLMISMQHIRLVYYISLQRKTTWNRCLGWLWKLKGKMDRKPSEYYDYQLFSHCFPNITYFYLSYKYSVAQITRFLIINSSVI